MIISFLSSAALAVANGKNNLATSEKKENEKGRKRVGVGIELTD